jgi:hypothetical protein
MRGYIHVHRVNLKGEGVTALFFGGGGGAGATFYWGWESMFQSIFWEGVPNLRSGGGGQISPPAGPPTNSLPMFVYGYTYTIFIR